MVQELLINFILPYIRRRYMEKTLESPLDSKEIQPVHPKGDQSWVFIGRTDAEAETPNSLATSCEELTQWKRPWCWRGQGGRCWEQGGEGDNRGWDGWMESPTGWTWVWVNSGSWWWTGRPGVLRFMGSQSQTWLSGWTELNMHLRKSNNQKPWKIKTLFWSPAISPTLSSSFLQNTPKEYSAFMVFSSHLLQVTALWVLKPFIQWTCSC